MIETARNKVLLASVILASSLGMAGIAGASTPPDPLTGTGGAIETVQDKVVGYAAPVAASIVVVFVAWVVVKLIPRVLRMISSRLG